MIVAAQIGRELGICDGCFSLMEVKNVFENRLITGELFSPPYMHIIKLALLKLD